MLSGALPPRQGAPIVAGRARQRIRFAEALESVCDADPRAALAIAEHVAALTRECARWRVRVRQLEQEVLGRG